MKKESWKQVHTQRGSATVEAVIALVGFLFTIFTILGLVNFCRAQMLVSSAVDTAALELSQYAYFYNMSGLQKFDKDLSANADVGKSNINEIIGTVDSFFSTVAGAVTDRQEEMNHLADVTQKGDLRLEDIQTTITNIGTDQNNIVNGIATMENVLMSAGDDPLLYMRSLVAIAGEEGFELAKRAIAAPLAKFFVQRHFGDSRETANAKLESLGIEGGIDSMNFRLSTLFSDENKEVIEIVVVYKVKLLQFYNWTPLEATISKCAVCRAWLGGDNVIVKVKADPAMQPSTGPAAGNETTPSQGQTQDQTQDQTQTAPETNPEPTPVDTTGSYWHLEQVVPGYDETEAAFIQMFKNTYGIEQDYASTLKMGTKGDTMYGMAECATAKDAENLNFQIYDDVIEFVASLEEDYVNSDGARGLEPGTITQYKCVIYVPENISDAELAAMKANVKKDSDLYYSYAVDTYGKSLQIEVEYVRAGGNYDYGSEGR